MQRHNVPQVYMHQVLWSPTPPFSKHVEGLMPPINLLGSHLVLSIPFILPFVTSNPHFLFFSFLLLSSWPVSCLLYWTFILPQWWLRQGTGILHYFLFKILILDRFILLHCLSAEYLVFRRIYPINLLIRIWFFSPSHFCADCLVFRCIHPGWLPKFSFEKEIKGADWDLLH